MYIILDLWRWYCKPKWNICEIPIRNGNPVIYWCATYSYTLEISSPTKISLRMSLMPHNCSDLRAQRILAIMTNITGNHLVSCPLFAISFYINHNAVDSIQTVCYIHVPPVVFMFSNFLLRCAELQYIVVWVFTCHICMYVACNTNITVQHKQKRQEYKN